MSTVTTPKVVRPRAVPLRETLPALLHDQLVACERIDLAARLRSSLEVPYKAGRIVKDYVFDLYFPAQRLSWGERLLCTPMVLLVEYMVYRVDSIAEKAKDVALDGRSMATMTSTEREAARQYKTTLDAYRAMFETRLRRARAYNEAVARQLDLGEQYVYLENKVTAHGVTSHAEVIQLAELRPSDVRLLHAMTFALLDRPVDKQLVDLLWPVEVLADIGNDLTHYQDDAAAGRFNTYDAFIQLYGPDAPERLRAEIARYEQLYRVELSKFPMSRHGELGALCARRYRARTRVVPEPHLLSLSVDRQSERTS
jgi:hypothetical protein